MFERTLQWFSNRFQKRSLMSDMLDARRSISQGGGPVSIPVTEKTAIKFSAVFASVRIIAETKASLPIDVYERKTGKDAKVKNHPVAQLLEFEPDEDFTPMVWNEVRQAHLCLWGNSYTELVFDGRTSDIARMVPLMPWNVEPFRGKDGRLYYQITDEYSGGTRIVDRSQMLHIPGFSFNGIVGMSVVRHFMADSIGLGMAADKFVASFYNNSGRPSMVIQVPSMLDDNAFSRLQQGVERQLQQFYKPLLLEHGATIETYTMPLAEAQLLESRKFQGEEIAARVFRLPPHVAGYLDHAKFNNIEAQDRYFEKHTMRPWLVRDEQEMNRTLFVGSERGRFYVKYNPDGILRGDQKTRYDAYRLALIAGWKTINEVRELEDLEPLPGGDDLPRPAAIWGKDEPGNDPINPGGGEEDSEDARVDPRLQAITTQVLRGLVHREAVQLTRLATKPAEFRDAVNSFYERHTNIVAEKLEAAGVSRGQLLNLMESHRQEILSQSNDPAAFETNVKRCVSSWMKATNDVSQALLLDAYLHTEELPPEGTENDNEN